MENIIEQIFEPQFRQISLRPVSGNNQIKGSGITYRPAPDVGEGYYWVQPIRDLCAVTIAIVAQLSRQKSKIFIMN